MMALGVPMNLHNFFFAILSMALCAVVVSADYPSIDQLPPHPELPDPLIMLDGRRVTSKDDWMNKRRPELKNLFQHYMYGYFPPPPEKITFHVDRVDPKALGGKATLKEITIAFGPPGTPKMQVLLFIPNKRQGPAPVFLGLNFQGNHTVVADPKVPLPSTWVPYNTNRGKGKGNRASENERGSQIDVWAIEQTIDRGYAVATVYCGDLDPDRADARYGIQPYLRKAGTSPGPNDWGTIAAWAWGLQRVVDYLITDRDIDAGRIIIVGHSRMGKAALLAAAFDERVAMAIPLQAGCGGTAPSRGTVGESVKRINTSFPHWFNGAFKEFNERPDRLPFDQHCLVALMAPRPVLFPNAAEDTWANPVGQFDVLKAAEPVYRLLGAGGLGGQQMPEQGKLMNSTLGYYIRAGNHSMTRQDWNVFVDFADKHLKKNTK